MRALSFTLSRNSPNFTGDLNAHQYREIFAASRGRYGTTLDYANQTLHCLRSMASMMSALLRLLAHARDDPR